MSVAHGSAPDVGPQTSRLSRPFASPHATRATACSCAASPRRRARPVPAGCPDGGVRGRATCGVWPQSRPSSRGDRGSREASGLSGGRGGRRTAPATLPVHGGTPAQVPHVGTGRRTRPPHRVAPTEGRPVRRERSAADTPRTGDSVQQSGDGRMRTSRWRIPTTAYRTRAARKLASLRHFVRVLVSSQSRSSLRTGGAGCEAERSADRVTVEVFARDDRGGAFDLLDVQIGDDEETDA